MDGFTEALTVLGTSMLPIVEVKGAIPIGVLTFGMPLWEAFILAIIGSAIPVPFILFFIRKVLVWLQKSRIKFFKRIADFIAGKVEKHKDKVLKYGYLAIFIFVAIPLPGTGVWTGSLLASMLNLRIKYALPVIIAGNVTASLCMIFLTHSIDIFI